MAEIPQYPTSISGIIRLYDCVVGNIDMDAQEAEETGERAYGGVLRAQKGKLQEVITHSLIMIAWNELSNDPNRIDINSKKIKLPIQESYLDKIQNRAVKEHIKNNKQDYVYGLSVDKHVFIDGQFALACECKAYAENAMIKRILIDFTFLKSEYPKLQCYLIQLESQLGGDYSNPNQTTTYGSQSTHTIMSYFDVDLNIITLLEGERKVKRPIHKSQYFKPLSKSTLEAAKDSMKQGLHLYV